MKTFSLAIGLSCLLALPLQAQSTEAGRAVSDYLHQGQPSQPVLSSEGEFIRCFHPTVVDWIKSPITASGLDEISTVLQPHLRIELNEMGFAPAATRLTDGKDETNYDAIWVRDNVWVYYALKGNPDRQEDAKRLLLALWDYYSTPAQVRRFESVIADPGLSRDLMEMPHIRFDGSSGELHDVIEDGSPQVWNHRQIDAHGLFFTALGEALQENLLTSEDLSPSRLEVLSLYPLFLQKIEFYRYEDAGAWEEIPRQNTSSIGLATRSLQVWENLLNEASPAAVSKIRSAIEKRSPQIRDSWSTESLHRLEQLGLETVKYQLSLGGESPDYPPGDVRFRRADAALVALLQPSPLEGLTESEKRRVLLIVESLKRPYGVLRYHNDSYQGGNYWIRPPAEEGPAPTGDTSSKEAFLWRLSKLPADSEAQWFFDSLLALARLHLAESTDNPDRRAQDIYLASIHLKRALGQITGPKLVAADGKPVREWQAPESINTVIVDDRRYYLPSPITPLNWAKAGLDMGLRRFKEVVF